MSLYCDAAESRPRPNHVAPNAERPNHVAPNATTVQLGLQWPPLAAGAALGECTVLERLNLANCNGLLSLPERLGECIGLQELELKFCTDLLTLPDLSGLAQLEVGRLNTYLKPWAASGYKALRWDDGGWW